jgi:signal transduction histidine kinase
MAGLAAERRQLDELVNGIADGVVLVDPSLRVVAANRAFSERLPADTPPDHGASYSELVRAAGFDRANRPSPAQRVLASGELETEILRLGGDGDGKERFEEIYAQPLRGPDGPVTAVIEVWRDITDRMALEAGREHSERLAALGMLATGIAHEVGNPLASIATAVEGLLRRLDEPGGAQVAELREYLEIVRKQVFRCHGVTQRLLGFARLPSREVGPVDAGEVAREVLALVSPQARGQNVVLKTALGEPAMALAEDLLLHHVFLNLVLNALRAMPDGGELRIETHVEPEAVRVLVADTGHGIPEEAQRHLFEPLRRAGPRGGTGLGLFLSHTLVRRCGGTITVESQPGAGAKFTVKLRRAPVAGAGRPGSVGGTP